MYKSFFGFQQQPFDKGIDSSMLFQSDSYKEVLARLDYLKSTRGFGLITGDPGVSKTPSLSYTTNGVAHRRLPRWDLNPKV